MTARRPFEARGGQVTSPGAKLPPMPKRPPTAPRRPEAELDTANGELKRLRAQRAAVLALHGSDLNVDTDLVTCNECAELWPCLTARALGVTA